MCTYFTCNIGMEPTVHLVFAACKLKMTRVVVNRTQLERMLCQMISLSTGKKKVNSILIFLFHFKQRAIRRLYTHCRRRRQKEEEEENDENNFSLQ